MTLTARDRKLLAVLVPVAALALFWFGLLSPKRDEAAAAETARVAADQRRDSAVARLAELTAAQASFPGDYAEVMRLGKALPGTLDMPSLVVQLDAAARGSGVSLQGIRAGGDGTAGAAGAAAPPGDAGGADPALKPGAGEAAPPTPVTLDLTLSGSYGQIADFLRREKRFVHVDGERIQVGGRLIAVNALALTPGPSGKLQAQVGATVWVAPQPKPPAGAPVGSPAPVEAAG